MQELGEVEPERGRAPVETPVVRLQDVDEKAERRLVAKLQAGATGYDIVVPSGYIVPVMVATDLITPITRK